MAATMQDHAHSAVRITDFAPSSDLASARFRLCALLIFVAVIGGGGGSPAPLAEAIVLVVALLVGITLVAVAPPDAQTFTNDRALWAIVGLIIAVPAVQLIPLPPGIWTALPGRETMREATLLVGTTDQWRPVSLFPILTAASLASLLPGLVILYGTLRLDTGERTALIGCVAVAALLSALLGIAQFTMRGASLWLYGDMGDGWARGFSANRNALPDLLIVGMLAAWVCYRAAGRPWGWAGRTGLITAIVVLIFATLASGSRAGIALAALLAVTGASGWLLTTMRRGRRGAAILLIVGIIAGGLGVASLLQNTALTSVGDRFAQDSEERPILWANTLEVAIPFLPIGSGVGTFVPVYAIGEPLDDLSTTYVNRAHNDYLETLLETGVFGPAVIVLLIGFIAVRARRKLRGPSHDRLHALFGAGIVTLIALHSVMDYPLRNLTCITLAGSALALIGSQGRGKFTRLA